MHHTPTLPLGRPGRRRSTFARLSAAVAVTGLLAASCAADDESEARPAAAEAGAEAAPPSEGHSGTDHDEPTAATAAESSGVDTPAAELRAGLTSLLQEHVYLAGAAISQAVADGGDLTAPATAAAVETLDANSVALSDAVASVYGDEAGEQFLTLWRDHIGFFVDYTLGGATGDAAAREAALAALDGYRTEFGAFIEGATGGELPGDALAADLQTHVETLTAAIDAILAGAPERYPALRAAAQHMPMTATALAGAIVAQDPEAFAG